MSALGTRDAAEAELENRAKTAHRIFANAMEHEQVRLASQATARTRDPEFVGALERYSSSDLGGVRFTSTLSNRFDYVALVGQRGSHVYSSRGADWSAFGADSKLVKQTRQGISEEGVSVTRDGTPVVFASLAVPIDAPTYGVILVAEPVKASDLQRIAAPLDLTLGIATGDGTRVSSQVGGEEHRSKMRTFTYPLRQATVSGGSSRLEVSLSTLPLTRATQSAAAKAGAVALVLALTLLLLVATLLNRAVLHPLASLRGAIRQVQGGAYEIALRFASSRELDELADGFNRMAAMVGEQKADLEAQATTDSLTGLANHAAFQSALAAAVEDARTTGRPLAVVAVDLDLFKEINDEHGHPEGDRVLCAVGQRLRESVRSDAVAARVGGDEFALMLPQTDGDGAVTVAERLREAAADISIAGRPISVSVGVACYPTDTDDPAALLELADRALYTAKRGGRGHARRYQPGGDRAATARIEPLLLDGGITPVFQPIVSLVTGVIAGYEALSRFPTQSGHSPDAIFAEAYRCGLGPQLEAHALLAALAIDGRPAGTYLTLNLTPSGISAPAVLAVLPADLTDIVVEVTEHEFVSDSDAFLNGLKDLRRRGARIALDDAGAGYAGLQQVTRVHPELIKLDRSLVADADSRPDQLAVIHALVTLAAHTDAQTCAEGIETIAELLTMARVGVCLGQGYLLARPEAAWPEVSEPALDALRSPPAPPLHTPYAPALRWVASST